MKSLDHLSSVRLQKVAERGRGIEGEVHRGTSESTGSVLCGDLGRRGGANRGVRFGLQRRC